jgi:glucose/arabinose dehydrogenase
MIGKDKIRRRQWEPTMRCGQKSTNQRPICMLLVSLLPFLCSDRLLRGDEVDQRPLSVGVEEAFPNIRVPRPVVLTHAGDGTNRLFVGSQFGQVHVLANDPQAEMTELYLDLSRKVKFNDFEDEEGFLGLAFHPRYKRNGYFFVYYTTVDAENTSVISRFRVSDTDPNRADPASEREILRIDQPYWNHNGGTLEFGPDGQLYIGLGDGGDTNDPHGHGQNLKSWHGSILRINVDGEQATYTVPEDNPFVGRKDARPEIWAYGFRNVWRLAFDDETGRLWAADNGENLWEEINLVRRGGNYGWNLREGRHKFFPHGSGPRDDLIEPIWEYHHKIGKSIIGGRVYRGRRVPSLHGAYLYGDYVSGDLWALWYDDQRKTVTANRELQGNGMPVITFGEDERGEVYFTTLMSGGVVYRFRNLPE